MHSTGEEKQSVPLASRGGNRLACSFFLSFFYRFTYFIYLFLAALGLRCCSQAFSSCGEWGLLFVAVHGLLIVVASLVEYGL